MANEIKWQKDLETFFPLYNSFIFEGYIDDDQPYEEEGELKYCKIYEYFDKIYSNHENNSLRKRVIIYDPTESEDKRFMICDNNFITLEEEDPNSEEGKPKIKLQYDSNLSQHFWDILHDEEISKLLIDHRDSGVSLDFSRIHYALTEHSGRIAQHEILERFVSFFDSLSNGFYGADEPSGYLFVIKMTSRLLTRDGQSNGLSGEELMIFRQLLNIAQSIDAKNELPNQMNHKLIILANQTRDLPSWFTDENANPFMRTINVTRPSEENKLQFFHEMLTDGVCFSEEFLTRYEKINESVQEPGAQPKRNPIEKKFLAYTNDFSMNMLRRYRDYLAEDNNKCDDDPSKIGFSISKFKVGDLTNPWDDEKRIEEMLNIKGTVSRKIQGQDEALQTAQDILTRAAIGLDRAKNPNAPRVVLFLAGPTGTGKTELCKQIAECIFGSEERIVRFDMSEYGQEESDQKLFGAPPGYVGYEEGGKLTNAVKKEPFSLVLFDEIEKAHNSILDKFLQILGDGRLTDGHGETVRFTDCIIVITSNAGVFPIDGMEQSEIDKHMSPDKKPEGEMNIEAVKDLEDAGYEPKEIYEKVKEHLRYNVKMYFNCKLKRPELYGRIEDSIVYYNYIGKESVAGIVNSTIEGTLRTTEETWKIKGVEEESLKMIKDKINNYCSACQVRALGARGIIKNTEKLFTGSLSNFLADYVRKIEGRRKQDLEGKVLVCSCEVDEIKSPNDIKWEVYSTNE